MSELEFLEHYNRKILKHGDNPEVLLKSLGRLNQVRVTIDLLAVSYMIKYYFLDFIVVFCIENGGWCDSECLGEEVL